MEKKINVEKKHRKYKVKDMHHLAAAGGAEGHAQGKHATQVGCYAVDTVESLYTPSGKPQYEQYTH